MISTIRDRWWVLHEDAIVTMLNRVEAEEITAEEALAVLIENTTKDESCDLRVEDDDHGA